MDPYSQYGMYNAQQAAAAIYQQTAQMSSQGTKRHYEDDSGSASYDNNKRIKQTTAGPSRVLHIRGVPSFCTEAQISQLCESIAHVAACLVIGPKQQAFVQFDTVEAATAVLTHYASNPAYIGNKPIYFQYSTREEVTSNPRYSGDNKTGEPPVNRVLLVSVHNVQIPVTIDHLAQIFQPYGGAQKIIMFEKNNATQALVQLPTTEAAITAKLHLEGKDMFQNCCTLSITFSKLNELNVKEDGPRSRDFSRPAPPFPAANTLNPYAPPMSGNPYGFPGMPPYMSQPGAMAQQQQQQSGCVLLVNNLAEGKASPDVLFTLFGVYGDVMRVKVLYNKPDTALIQFASAQQASLAHMHLNNVPLFGKPLSISISKHKDVALPRDTDHAAANLTKDFSNSPLHRFKKPGSKNAKNISAPSRVLFLSNLVDNNTTDEIKALLGDKCEAVEFFKTDKKMAFVRMASLDAAVEALVHFHNYKLKDRYLRISFSHKPPAEVGAEKGDSTGADGTAPEEHAEHYEEM